MARFRNTAKNTPAERIATLKGSLAILKAQQENLKIAFCNLYKFQRC
jgi:hypothetical protein